MKFKVIVKQKIEYTEKLEAEFASMEEVELFIGVILHSCKKVCVEVFKIGEEEIDD